jgi:phage baseplate assembly protein gpV
MEALLNRVRLEAERVGRLKGKTRLGTITSYDPANYAVKVMLQPDQTETGFIPLSSPMIGNGWGAFFAPVGGEQVIVEFQEDGHEVPLATLRLFDNKNRPLTVPGSEMWLVHKSGSYLKLTSDGKVALHSAGEIDVGNVSGTFQTLLTDAFLSIFNNHVHTNGNSGANTGMPVTPLTSGAFTAVLKAN